MKNHEKSANLAQLSKSCPAYGRKKKFLSVQNFIHKEDLFFSSYHKILYGGFSRSLSRLMLFCAHVKRAAKKTPVPVAIYARYCEGKKQSIDNLPKEK